jgi:ribonuclease P protein component
MFARSQRLKKSSDISRLYKRGNRAFSHHLKLHFLTNPRGGLRVAVVASKKLDKRAVVRNKAKRRVREILKAELSGVSDIRFDILVTIQVGIEDVSVDALRQEIQQLVRRLK